MADRRSEYVVSDLRGEFTHLTELLESYGGAQDFTGAHRHEGSDDRGHTFSTAVLSIWERRRESLGFGHFKR